MITVPAVVGQLRAAFTQPGVPYVEQARLIQLWKDISPDITHRQMAAELRMSAAVVANRLRILSVHPELLSAIDDGRLSYSTLRDDLLPHSRHRGWLAVLLGLRTTLRRLETKRLPRRSVLAFVRRHCSCSGYNRKFREGRVIGSIGSLDRTLRRGGWVFWNHKPQHPGWIIGMPLRTLQGAVDAGIVRSAIPMDRSAA